MGRKEIQTTGFSEFPLYQSFGVRVCWYPPGAEDWLKTRPWRWSSILPLVKTLTLPLVRFCIKNSDANLLLPQIQHMPCVTITRVFSGLCRGPEAISPWNTVKLPCALTRIFSCVFPFLRWYEFAGNCPHLRFVNCCSRNCLWLPKQKDVGAS